MVYRGIARGKTIELEETLPYEDGEVVQVEVQPLDTEAEPGTAAAILEAVRKPPHLTKEDVDEFERLIEEGKRPLSKPVRFDK